MSAGASERCPLCGAAVRAASTRAGEAFARAIDASEIGSTRRASGDVAIAVCATCEGAWQVNPPGETDLNRAYEDMRDEAYVAETGNRQRTFERSLRLMQRYGVGAGAGTSLLDVGCSAGLFLDVATKGGFDARGVEPSRWLSEKARERLGDRVVTARLDEAKFDRPFDVVTMWDVLEHVPEPQEFLRLAGRVVRPGGLLFINVPARDTLVARALGRRWPLLLPEHLFYFSRASLRILLERAGFEVLGFHSHLVFFSAEYVLRRLAQHDWPGVGRAARVLGSGRVGKAALPMLMGEVTVVARLGTPTPSAHA